MSINYIVIHNKNDLESVIESELSITGYTDQETLSNMWAISVDSTINSKITIDQMLNFLDTLLKKRKTQISQLNITYPVVFYMWVDEMALQLRFNIISKLSDKLPFACHIHYITLPDIILKRFLEICYQEEIGWDEFEEIENELEDESDDFVLDVFVTEL